MNFENPPQPNDLACYFDSKTGITTLRFGVHKIGDAGHAVRSLAMMYEEQNKLAENMYRQVPQGTIDSLWAFARGLGVTERAIFTQQQ